MTAYGKPCGLPTDLGNRSRDSHIPTAWLLLDSLQIHPERNCPQLPHPTSSPGSFFDWKRLSTAYHVESTCEMEAPRNVHMRHETLVFGGCYMLATCKKVMAGRQFRISLATCFMLAIFPVSCK